MSDKIIAIIGRPNVGKSMLFNRLVGGRAALVHDSSGVTRDRRYGTAKALSLQIVDTGGIDLSADESNLFSRVKEQTEIAIEEASVILFVLDGRAGIMPDDYDVAKILRRTSKPVICVVNKIDTAKSDLLMSDFYKLGFDPTIAVSAAHGRGADNLIDAMADAIGDDLSQNETKVINNDEEIINDVVVEKHKDLHLAQEYRDNPDRPIRISFLGKPNAGKSSMMNRLSGEERSAVDSTPGTTTDPIDVLCHYNEQAYKMVDTAGIRRRASRGEAVERISISIGLSRLKETDVTILVIDSTLGITVQDSKIAGLIEESGSSIIIALNKSDKVSSIQPLHEQIKDRLPFLSYAKVVSVSALTGQGFDKLMNTVNQVVSDRRYRVSTAKLNRFFQDVCERHPPPTHKGRSVRIYYLTQGGVDPPTFILWVSRPDSITKAYKRFVANQMRQHYGFEGSPVWVVIKASHKLKIA